MSDWTWTEQDETRYQQYIAHMLGCTSCELRNADDSSRLCAELESMLSAGEMAP